MLSGEKLVEERGKQKMRPCDHLWAGRALRRDTLQKKLIKAGCEQGSRKTKPLSPCRCCDTSGSTHTTHHPCVCVGGWLGLAPACFAKGFSSLFPGGTPRTLSAIDRAGAEVKSRTTLFRKVIVCFSTFILLIFKRWHHLVVPKYPPRNWESLVLFYDSSTDWLFHLQQVTSSLCTSNTSLKGFKLLGEKYISCFYCLSFLGWFFLKHLSHWNSL